MRKAKRVYLVIGIIVVIGLVVGLSYAYWQLSFNQVDPNKAITNCLEIELVEESPEITIEDAYPITDEEGKRLDPFTFTIKNTCDSFVSYEVALGIADGTTLDSQYVAAVLDYNQIQTLNNYEEVTLNGYQEGRLLQKGSLSGEDEVTYNLRLWLDYDTPYQEDIMSTSFLSQIVVTAGVGVYSPVDQGFTTIADAILVNEYQSTSVEDAKAKIASKQEVDFTKTAPIIDWQESHAQTTAETTATMPHPDLVGNGEDYTKNLTSTNVLVRIGTEYEFDSTTGKYTFTEYQNVDPTTLDYNGEQNYYYCGSGMNTSSTDLISTYQNYSGCTTIYKLTGATKEESKTTGAGGTEIKTMIYRMTGYRYTQTELESDKSDKGLYTIEDADGTSYYYRGSVANNYVSFAGYYWRIIRINGDGSIRLLYAGETADATGNNLNMKLTDSSLGYSNRTTIPFNTTRTDPAYVGYMYGNTLGTSYEQTNANEVDSNIKKYLDSWYRQNILDKGYTDYIADSGFCNDRSLSTVNNNGDGVSTSGYNTYYAGYQRYYNLQTPSLVCPNESNDLFTTSSSDKGNKKLTYPIGLITVDELALSGYANNYLNKSAYTYSSSTYWTMSPSYFDVGYSAAIELTLYSEGYVDQWRWVTAGWVGVRAVINLKSDTQISGGIGTANDPYTIKEVA